MRPQLLLITGAHASGKSRLAERLAGRFQACCCSRDEIKELLFDVLGAGDTGWSRTGEHAEPLSAVLQGREATHKQ